MTGRIFNIQRFSVQDGPGIRTTVFFKGCPLRCVWCHNPESQQPQSELAWHPEKCIGCGACFAACQQGCHILEQGKHVLLREKCIGCGRCTQQCYAQALEMLGKETTLEEVLQTVLADRDFYAQSGGGVTLSGGEPLAQPEFAIELAKQLHQQGISVCVETCGYCSPQILEEIAPFVSAFLYDYKISDNLKHKKYTGVYNKKIMDNLELLSRLGAAVVLRCPIIPGINENQEHQNGIIQTAQTYSCIQSVDLEAYHPLGISKSGQLGHPVLYDNPEFLEKEKLRAWQTGIQKAINLPVNIL